MIQKLVDEMKHDEEFITSKPIKKIIKIAAAECLQSSNEPESNPADPKLDESKEADDQPEANTTKKDSPSLHDQSPVPASRAPSNKKIRASTKGVFKSSEMIDSDGNSIHENEESTSTKKPTSSKSKVTRERKPRKPKKSKADPEHVDNNVEAKSDGEEKPMSSPPPKKSGKGKRESLPVDKDEERIKKLKSLVVACGLRKQWKKEFQDCPTNKQQIRHLTKILEDLGMTGRMSMAKAKEIKARRDLEAEVNELAATRETESSDGSGGEEEDQADQDQATDEGDGKKTKVAKRKKNRAFNNSSGDESSDAPNKPKKKKNPFAFLGDQGSEDSS